MTSSFRDLINAINNVSSAPTKVHLKETRPVKKSKIVEDVETCSGSSEPTSAAPEEIKQEAEVVTPEVENEVLNEPEHENSDDIFNDELIKKLIKDGSKSLNLVQRREALDLLQSYLGKKNTPKESMESPVTEGKKVVKKKIEDKKNVKTKKLVKTGQKD